jgi:hypothetical protein
MSIWFYILYMKLNTIALVESEKTVITERFKPQYTWASNRGSRKHGFKYDMLAN